MLGTNNTGHFPIEKEPPEATVLGMQAVVRAIRAKQPQAKLVICAIFPCDDKADGLRRLRNEIVNKEIQKLADNPVVQVDEKGVTNRWFDVVMVGDSITHRWERSGCGGDETWALLTNRYAVLNLGYGGDSTARSRGRCSPICCIRRRRAIAPGMTGSCRPFVSWSENKVPDMQEIVER